MASTLNHARYSTMDDTSNRSLIYSTDTPATSTPILTQKPSPHDSQAWETTPMVAYAEKPSVASQPKQVWYRRPLVLAALLAAVAIVLAAVLIPVGLLVIRNKVADTSNGTNGGGGSGGSTGGGGTMSNPESPTGAITGGNGSLILLSDGSNFTYVNNFGGIWYSDPDDPYNDSAYPNSWTPPLNQSFPFGQVPIYGVNLGGWLVLEPFIRPDLYQKYQSATPPAVDEWTLSEAMRNDTSPGGGIEQIEEHYKTFITEKDFAEIAAAGLNFVRLPVPFWIFGVWNNEPFLAQTAWKYALQAFEWARKYGLRVNLDLHTIPGSQNGYNHSGRSGQINFLLGIMGIANAQRTLDYIRSMTEFITQPQYSNLVQIWGFLNEPLVGEIGMDVISSFYFDAYHLIRNITGVGTGKGAMISMHDGFEGQGSWYGFLQGADRLAIDVHPYQAFGGGTSPDPTGPCLGWGLTMDTSQSQFGFSMAGEFSAGFNPCGLYLTGPDDTSGVGGDCDYYNDVTQWNATTVQQVLNFTVASMSALENWFFWTWKIGNDSTSGAVRAPLWSYQLGLQYGYVPSDPRVEKGVCNSLIAPQQTFNGTYPQPYMTGGPGAGNINATFTALDGQWPVQSLRGLVAGTDPAPATLLPTYTATGPILTLPPLTFSTTTTSGSVTVTQVMGSMSVKGGNGDGWFDTEDTVPGVVAVAGCSYPDPWSAGGLPSPTAAFCAGSGTGSAVLARRTEPPV